MGIYVNPGNVAFEMARFSNIYVDKSMLIAKVNEVYRTEVYLCKQAPSVLEIYGSKYAVFLLQLWLRFREVIFRP